MIRLIRDGMIWQYANEWPSPHGLGKLPFQVTDIFFDPKDEVYIVFGTPQKGSAEHAKGVCIFALVPLDLGSAIVESLLPMGAAVAEVRQYIAESEVAWADRWSGDDDDDDDDDDDGGTDDDAKKKLALVPAAGDQ
jgi:hypothetical protein